jgi:hypothetical protein
MRIEIVLSNGECAALECLAEALGETVECSTLAILSEWLRQQGYLENARSSNDNVAPQQ